MALYDWCFCEEPSNIMAAISETRFLKRVSHTLAKRWQHRTSMQQSRNTATKLVFFFSSLTFQMFLHGNIYLPKRMIGNIGNNAFDYYKNNAFDSHKNTGPIRALNHLLRDYNFEYTE